MPGDHSHGNERVVRLRSYTPVGVIVCLVTSIACALHWSVLAISSSWQSIALTASFTWLTLHVIAAHCHEAKRSSQTINIKVAAIIAIRQANPAAFHAMLHSLDHQINVRLHSVHVIENGTKSEACKQIFDRWCATTTIAHTTFVRTAHPKKRIAQSLAFIHTTADIIMTVDGNVRLDPRAVKNALKLFADQKVMAVAGLLVGHNRTKNLLTRALELSTTSSFMHDRAAWSELGSVGTTSGGLAFYRSLVVTAHLADYLGHTVIGSSDNHVDSGDDRMLTNLAARYGRTHFQPSCVGYMRHPEGYHEVTMRDLRWWRTYWLNIAWLARHGTIRSALWWQTLLQASMFVLHGIAFPVLLVFNSVTGHGIFWAFPAWLIGCGYVRAFGTLAIRRPDQSLCAQLLSFALLMPLVTVLDLWLRIALLWVGLFTCHRTAWHIRAAPSVEKAST